MDDRIQAGRAHVREQAVDGRPLARGEVGQRLAVELAARFGGGQDVRRALPLISSTRDNSSRRLLFAPVAVLVASTGDIRDISPNRQAHAAATTPGPTALVASASSLSPGPDRPDPYPGDSAESA